MLYGHGSDNPRQANPPYFIVPDGCYIVATTHIGSYGDFDQIPKNLKVLHNLQKKFPDVITNPIKYIPNIQHALPKIKDASQSIVIYGPGESCPDFSFHLYDLSLGGGHLGVKCIDGPAQKTSITNLIPITFNEMSSESKYSAYFTKQRHELQSIVRDIINDTILSDRDTIPDLIPFNEIHIHLCTQYVHSIFPTVEDIFYMIEHHILTIMREEYAKNPDKELEYYIKTNERNLYVYSFNDEYVTNYLTIHWESVVMRIIYMLHDNKDDITISQSRLCYLYPGVYYNFLCRVRYEKTYDSTKKPSGIHKILTGPRLKNIQPTITRINSPRLSPKTRKILTNRIEEAQKRKRIQRQLYNTDIYREKRKKENIEHWRTTSGQKELGEGIMQARITRKKATVAKAIQKVEAEKAAFLPNNLHREQKIATRDKRIKKLMNEYTHLHKMSKQMKNNYANFIRYYETVTPNGNYVKLKSHVKRPTNRNWITRKSAHNRGLTEANYTEPVIRSAKHY